ncbi:lipopolysaccharide biosynthesis protein [Zobellia nedashkovskayae]|uniref:lipopolysaccharide biosynthesis protein n=1 Tax=Zobellia nedashkovskayae TaxID=2779510 RepID=UPI00188AAFBE|nr:oligosaccharide flippase family protein [Zobellia nedashkovskayae]
MTIFKKIQSIFSKGHERSSRAKKNILLTILIKGIGILVGFLYFPLSLDYLGTVKFGIYLTLLSVIDWFLNFDIGIGLGLRNKFGEAVAQNKDEEAVTYVSTAYFALGAIIIVVVVVLLILNFTTPWTSLLNIDTSLVEEVKWLGAVIIVAFGIRFIAGNIYEIFYAFQKMAYVEYFTLLTKLSFLLLIFVIPFIVSDSLLLFGSAKALTFALVPLGVGIFYFRRKFIKYRPSFKHVNRAYFKDIFSLGTKFFVIKMAMLVIHQTNNILIASFVSLDGVPQYEAAFKYLSIFTMLFVIISNQLWPSNIEAYAKGDFEWMKKSLKTVLKVWFGTLAIAVVMVLVSPFVYSLWLQDNLEVPIAISIAVAISVSLSTWVNIFNIVLNGTGKVRLQMYAWVFAALINIPASIFFVKVLDLGVVGIVLGTVASLVPVAIVSPIQVSKILSKNDKGLWAR